MKAVNLTFLVKLHYLAENTDLLRAESGLSDPKKHWDGQTKVILSGGGSGRPPATPCDPWASRGMLGTLRDHIQAILSSGKPEKAKKSS